MTSKDPLKTIYRESLSLLTDLYELTMAYGYWKLGIAEREAAFHLFFRRKPFGGGFAVAAGLEVALDFLERFHYSASDLAYLEQLKGSDGSALFDLQFLEYLGKFSFKCDIDAMPEADKAAFAALDLGIATLKPEELGPALDEPHPSWMERIETEWKRRYGAAN